MLNEEDTTPVRQGTYYSYVKKNPKKYSHYSSSPPNFAKKDETTMTTLTPADAVMLAVWKDIEGYLDFADVSRVAGVSRRFRSVAVLGGGRQDQDGDDDDPSSSPPSSLSASTTPGFRSFHRFR